MTAGLADAMVDVLEELTRRVRGLRVEFEALAASNRPVAPAITPPVEPAPARAPAGVPAPQASHPGY